MKAPSLPHTLLAVAVFGAAVPAFSQITITLNPTADAGIRSTFTSNNGSSGEMLAGMVTSADIIRSVLAFDLSSIPAGATIHSVSLRLVTTTTDTGSTATTNLTFNLHQLTQSFTSSGVTWYNREGTPSATPTLAAQPNPWSTLGGTFNSATVLSSISANPTTVAGGTAFIFDTGGNFTSAVGSAIGDMIYLIAKLENEGGSSRNLLRFNTVEATTVANRPQLTITYTPIPEPSAFAALAGLGTLGFAATRRRR